MKKVILIIACIFLIALSPLNCIAEIPIKLIDSLSPSDKTKLISYIDAVISKKEIGLKSPSVFPDLGMDLMELSVEELQEMKEYLNNGSLPSNDATREEYIKFDNAAVIAASYNYWASSFGATDIAWNTDIQDDIPGNSNEKTLYTDDLAIDFDFSSGNDFFETKQIVLFVNAHGGGTSAYNQARSLGLFAALEYGQPTTRDAKEIDSAYMIAKEAFDDYTLAMVSYMDRIYAGDHILFRMNEHGRYYIAYLDSIGFCIIVE